MDGIKVIKLEPYDVILLTYATYIDADTVENQRKSWQKLFPECVVVVNRNDYIQNIFILRNPEGVKL
jgi:hypothetical protein